MNISIDLNEILRTYDSMKQELVLCKANRHLSNLSEARDQLSLRELQLKSVLEISEKIIQYINSFPKFWSINSNQPRFDTNGQDFKDDYFTLENLYWISEENLKKSKAEVSHLRSELEKLGNANASSNFFTVEVYQSEIEDLKRNHSEKLMEMQKKINDLQCSRSSVAYNELKKKYEGLKHQMLNMQKKVLEFQEALLTNNEQKKISEEKYNKLVQTHKKMFAYLEKLEVKVRIFQERVNSNTSFTTKSKSRDCSLSSLKLNDESKLECLSVCGPILVFSV